MRSGALVAWCALAGPVILLTACGPIHRITAATSPAASPTAAATPTPSPNPVVSDSNFRQPPAMWDVDLVDASLGWILGSQCIYPDTAVGDTVASPARTGVPQTGLCQYWVQPVDVGSLGLLFSAKVGPEFGGTDGDAPRLVHFLNRTDGFVYGHSAAFVTHDGGHTWADSGLPTFEVVSITGRGAVAWAVTRDCAKGTTCAFSVRLSSDAGHTWSQAHALPDGFGPVNAAAFEPGGLVAWGFSDLVLTSDGGSTWSQIKGQCAGDLALRDFAVTPDGRQLWQLCTAFPPADDSKRQLFLSEDGGVSWSIRSGQLPVGVQLFMAAPAVGTVVIGSNRQQMVVSHDAGLTWSGAEVRFPPNSANHLAQVRGIRFATAKDGFMFDADSKVWATQDGGDTWALLYVWLRQP